MTTITTDGVTALADGTHLITALQTVPQEQPSAASPSLTINDRHDAAGRHDQSALAESAHRRPQQRDDYL